MKIPNRKFLSSSCSRTTLSDWWLPNTSRHFCLNSLKPNDNKTSSVVLAVFPVLCSHVVEVKLGVCDASYPTERTAVPGASCIDLPVEGCCCIPPSHSTCVFLPEFLITNLPLKL